MGRQKIPWRVEKQSWRSLQHRRHHFSDASRRLDVLRGLKTHILAQLSNFVTSVMGSRADLPWGRTGLPGESRWSVRPRNGPYCNMSRLRSDRSQGAARSVLHSDSSLIDDEVHSRKLNKALNMCFRCFKCRAGIIALQGVNDGKMFRRIWCQAVFQLADFKEARGGSQIA